MERRASSPVRQQRGRAGRPALHWQERFPRRHYDRSKTENRAALRPVERRSGRGGGQGRGSTRAQASQESEEGKKRKDRPRGNLRRARSSATSPPTLSSTG